MRFFSVGTDIRAAMKETEAIIGQKPLGNGGDEGKRITAGLVDGLERGMRWGLGKGHQAINKS
jgi:hypothetical protein